MIVEVTSNPDRKVMLCCRVTAKIGSVVAHAHDVNHCVPEYTLYWVGARSLRSKRLLWVEGTLATSSSLLQLFTFSHAHLNSTLFNP